MTGTIGQDLAELLDRSDERDLYETRIEQAFREGYVHGAQDQWAAGYVAAIADVKRMEHELVDAARLVRARRAPAGAAWLDTVKRNGGTEYGGAGKPRVPVDPAAVELAKVMLRGRLS